MPHLRHRELDTVASDGETERVLAIASLAEVAEAWCDYVAVTHDVSDDAADDPNWWALEFYWNCIANVPGLWRGALLELDDRARGDRRLLSVIGAGPFEDLMQGLSPEQVEWIERNAAFSEPFRVALQNMRLPRDVSDDVRVRINRARRVAPDRWLFDDWGRGIRRAICRDALARDREMGGECCVCLRQT